MTRDVKEVLAERQTTHGNFEDNARIMQGLKRLVRNELIFLNKSLTDTQAEALDMILHKIGRIVTGNANLDDHWLDIAGYAKLVADKSTIKVKDLNR